jgi:hypothetical protein
VVGSTVTVDTNAVTRMMTLTATMFSTPYAHPSTHTGPPSRNVPRPRRPSAVATSTATRATPTAPYMVLVTIRMPGSAPGPTR